MQTIILICQVPSFVEQIRSLLQEHDPHLKIIDIRTREEMLSIHLEVVLNARLISFVSGVIVPSWFLNAVGYGAINFHGGPPEYPGWAPTCFALYEGAESFGVTAHEMQATVDSGDIVGVQRFAISPNISHAVLVGMMVHSLFELFRSMSRHLATEPMPFPRTDERWGPLTYTKAMAHSRCKLQIDDGEENIIRCVRAFGSGWADAQPSISVGEMTFVFHPKGEGQK